MPEIRNMVTQNAADLPDGYKMTELGPLPADWRVVRLGEVAEKPQYGFTASAQREAVGPKMLRITDIQNGSVNWDNVPYCECPKEEILRYLLRPGDILFARTGSVGKAFLVSSVPEPAIFASYLIRLRVNRALLDPQFAYLFMQSAAYWSQIASQTHGAVQPNVNATQLRSLFIPLPPLAEQRAIAHVLRTVQRAQEASERVIAALRELKKSLMRHLFTYGPVPVDQVDQFPLQDTELGPLPAHWQVVRLGEVGEVRGGSAFPYRFQGKRRGEYPFFKVSDMNSYENRIWMTKAQHYVDEKDLTHLRAKLFPRGTIIFPKIGGAIFTNKKRLLSADALIDNNVMGITVREESCDHLVLFYYLESIDLRDFARIGPLPSITSQRVKDEPIPLPPLAEQSAIAHVLRAVDRRIEAEEAYARAAQELFRSLLQELMSGRRRLPAEFVARFQQEEPRVSV